MSEACSVNIQPNIAQSIMTKESVENNTKPNISSPSKFEIANNSEIKINHLIDLQEKDSAELCCARVKLAKKQFFINIIEMTASLIAFTVSVGMTVCSGGTTAPLAVLTGLNLVSSLANLACAYHDWDCASKGKPELTMGNDALQQLVFILAKNAQVSPSNAKKIARITSYLIKTGIFIALGAVGFVIHPMINSSVCLLARNYAPILTSMLSTAATGVLSTWIGNNNDEIESALDKLIENEKEVVHQIALLEGKLTTIVG